MASPEDATRARVAGTTGDSAFLPVNEATLRRIQPAVDERYFSNRKQLRYQRHRIVQIDEALLESQFERAWRAYERGGQLEPIVVTLFNDETFAIIVESLSETVFGSVHFMGIVLRDDDPIASAWFRFRSRGEVQASIRTSEAKYTIELAGERPYYVVFEYAPPGPDTVFD